MRLLRPEQVFSIEGVDHRHYSIVVVADCALLDSRGMVPELCNILVLLQHAVVEVLALLVHPFHDRRQFSVVPARHQLANGWSKVLELERFWLCRITSRRFFTRGRRFCWLILSIVLLILSIVLLSPQIQLPCLIVVDQQHSCFDFFQRPMRTQNLISHVILSRAAPHVIRQPIRWLWSRFRNRCWLHWVFLCLGRFRNRCWLRWGFLRLGNWCWLWSDFRSVHGFHLVQNLSEFRRSVGDSAAAFAAFAAFVHPNVS